MARRAVVVGCSGYTDPRISDLRFAHSDARRFAANLVKFCDFEESQVSLLCDGGGTAGEPTRDGIFAALTQVLDESDSLDLICFYFSGHGFHSARDGDDYLLTRGSSVRALEQTSLAYRTVISLLRESEARQMMLVLDACRAVTAGKGHADFSPPSSTNLAVRGAITFASCGPDELSYEDTELESGLFTQVLLEALSDTGRCITVADVDDYLRTHTPALARRLGKPHQRPHTVVDPLSLQDVELVSPVARNIWRAEAPIGREIRYPIPLLDLALPPDPVLGLDFGTTYSAAAVSDTAGHLHFIPGAHGGTLVPSVITFFESGDYVVGEAALDAEYRTGSVTIKNVKRDLGTSATFRVANHQLTPDFVTSLIIRSLRQNAVEALGIPIRVCMSAYPANFSINQTNILHKALSMAGLDILRMVGEPNIAAVLLGVDRPAWEGVCLVVDLGGGTFDVAVVDYGQNVCMMESVGGDVHLGGVDFDECIAVEVERRLREQFPGLILGRGLERVIRREAQRAKHELSGPHNVGHVVLEVERDARMIRADMTLTRGDMAAAFQPLCDRIRTITLDTIDDAWTRDGIATVLFTGQGSKIYAVREAVESLGLTSDYVLEYQENAVALGLATYSRLLRGIRPNVADEVLLVDLSHRGFGIRLDTAGGEQNAYRKDSTTGTHVVVLIKRLSAIPTRAQEVFQFVGHADEALQFSIVERSRISHEDVDIGAVRLPAAGPSLEVRMSLDIDNNSAAFLMVEDLTNQSIFYFQLNHLYRRAHGRLDDYVRRLLDGWTVHPVTPITSFEDASSPTAGERLSTADLDGYLTELTERHEVLLERLPGLTDPQDVRVNRTENGRLLTLKAGILAYRGDVIEGAEHCLAGLSFLVGTNAWSEIEMSANFLGRIYPKLPEDEQRRQLPRVAGLLSSFGDGGGPSQPSAQVASAALAELEKIVDRGRTSRYRTFRR